MRPGSISKCYKGMFSEKKNKIKRVAGEARGKKGTKEKDRLLSYPTNNKHDTEAFSPTVSP